MIDKYGNIRCDICGKYISIKSLEEGKSIHKLLYPDSDYSVETFESICYGCNREIKEEVMSKQYSGKLLTSKSPSGNMLYGDKTDKERKNEQQEYKEKMLNEDK